MCGIIGILRKDTTGGVLKLLLEGLKQIDHRGYDGFGVRCIGKPIAKTGFMGYQELHDKVLGSEEDRLLYDSYGGIAHNRWGTHGLKIALHAHPFAIGKVTLVHNGTIQNFVPLFEKAYENGYRPTLPPIEGERECPLSAKDITEDDRGTDTELIAFLLDQAYNETHSVHDALKNVLPRLVGTFGLIIMFSDWPHRLVVARRGSPVLVAEDDRGYYIASEQVLFPPSVHDMHELPDDYYALVEQRHGINFYSLDGKPQTISQIAREIFSNAYTPGDHGSFMEREIYDQPLALRDALRGRYERGGDIRLDGLDPIEGFIKDIRHIVVVACGTSYHAGLYFKSVCNEFAEIPVTVEYASEMNYSKMLYPKESTLVLALSQSGETEDVRAVIERLKKQGYVAAGFINGVGSTIARLCRCGVYLQCGPEKGVASTKAFTAQCMLLGLFAVKLGLVRGTCLPHHVKEYLEGVVSIPDYMETILTREKVYLTREVIDLCAKSSRVLFVGAGSHAVPALEGALKFKEITYIAAEGFSAGEFKHGHLALVSNITPVVMSFPGEKSNDPVFGKLSDAFQITRANGSPVILFGDQNPKTISGNDVYTLPLFPDGRPIHHLISPIVETVWLQLLAIRVGERLGNNVDKPRNLAKAVTV